MPELYVARAVTDGLHNLPGRPWEVGGWLLGYWTEDRDALFVTHATPPGPRGLPNGIWISGRGHRKRFDTAWEASGGIVTFLGDWHSHPGGPTSPSDRDERAARQLAEEEDYRTPEPLLGIVSLPRRPRREMPRGSGWWLRSREGELQEVTPHLVDSLPATAARVPQWPLPRARAEGAREAS